MNASSFIEIIEIALHHIGDDVHVVLMAAEFEGTTVRARGVQAQDCFGCHYFGYRPTKGTKYLYICIYIYIYMHIHIMYIEAEPIYYIHRYQSIHCTPVCKLGSFHLWELYPKKKFSDQTSNDPESKTSPRPSTQILSAQFLKVLGLYLL